MATGVEDGDGSGSEELLKLVRDCFRDEIADCNATMQRE